MNRQLDPNMSEVAHNLHQIIKDAPGIHFRSLGREAGLSSVGQLRHHLDSLRRRGAIVEIPDGRFKRFFVAGEHDPQLRDGLARFARRVPRRIAKLLLSRPMNRTEIRRSLNCADSTLGYHLNRMVELGDLERTRGRNCCIYSLQDPEFVRQLVQFHPAPSDRARQNGSHPPNNGNNGNGHMHPQIAYAAAGNGHKRLESVPAPADDGHATGRLHAPQANGKAMTAAAPGGRPGPQSAEAQAAGAAGTMAPSSATGPSQAPPAQTPPGRERRPVRPRPALRLREQPQEQDNGRPSADKDRQTTTDDEKHEEREANERGRRDPERPEVPRWLLSG